jgi:adiponectin receptor
MTYHRIIHLVLMMVCILQIYNHALLPTRFKERYSLSVVWLHRRKMFLFTYFPFSTDPRQEHKSEVSQDEEDDDDNDLLSTHILRAIQKSDADARHLISFQDLPYPWRINPYILSGYQFSSSVWRCFTGIFHLSNESFNVWSHVFGLVSMLVIAWVYFPLTSTTTTVRDKKNVQVVATNAMMDTVVVGGYFLAAAVCFGCSVLWHTMKSISSPRLLMRCASIDLMGVSVIVSATAVVTEYTAFYGNPPLQMVYISLTALCAVGCLILGWQPQLRDPAFAWVRVSMFVLLGVTGLVPFLHLAIVRGLSWAVTFYRPLMIRVFVPVFSGAMVYASKIPEKWCPGWFDFVGSSHNWWHVAVLITVWGGCVAMRELFQLAVDD